MVVFSTRKLTVAFLSLTLISQVFPATLVQAEDVTVNAGVLASPTDFQADLSLTTTDDPVEQNQVLTYQLHYGTYLPYETDITIEADWTLGSLPGDTVPTIPVVVYVPNSASNAYNDTPPVLELTHKKIIWTIEDFPENTPDQLVTFQLRVLDNDTTTSPIRFTVNGRAHGVGASTPDSSVTRSYKHHVGIQPTQTPAPAPTTIVTPTPIPTLFAFNDVAIETIATSSAKLLATLSQPGTITINYGTDPKNLNQRTTSLERKTVHSLSLAGLQLDTPYFLRLQATDGAGGNTSSDIYSFTTAAREQSIVVQPNSVVISNRDLVMQYSASGENLVVIPQNTPFSVQVKVYDPTTVKQMQLFLRNSRILGLSTFKAEAATPFLLGTMQMLQPGVFSGRLMEQLPGHYELYSKLSDHNGNITEQQLFKIRIAPPLTIYEEGTKNPIENAKVLLSTYNAVTRLYEPISQFMIENPVYSDHAGRIQIVLPTNRYRAAVSATGYDAKEVTFSLGEQSSAVYPMIYLKKQPFSVLSFAQSLHETTTDSIKAFHAAASLFAVSSRFSTLSAVLIVSCFVALTLLSFSARTRVPLLHLPHFLSQHLRNLACPMNGKISDEHGNPVSGCRILFFDGKNRINGQTLTNKYGIFNCRNCGTPEGEELFVEVVAIGFKPLRKKVTSQTKPVNLVLTNQPQIAIHDILTHSVAWFISWFFEFFLLASFLLEVALGFTWGFARVAPFITLSMLNAALWILFLSKHGSK